MTCVIQQFICINYVLIRILIKKESFNYLESTTEFDGASNKDIRKRTNDGQRIMIKLNRILCSTNIIKKTK